MLAYWEPCQVKNFAIFRIYFGIFKPRGIFRILFIKAHSSMQSTSAISDTRYLELPLYWTIFSVSSVIFGLLLMCYFEHLNEVFEWILPFISGIWILICIWQSFVRKFVLSFFQHCSGNNLSSIIGKAKWKKFRR